MPRISCQVCPLKCISIVDASKMAKTIINDEQIMRHNNQLSGSVLLDDLTRRSRDAGD